jgi:hypothetical protein
LTGSAAFATDQVPRLGGPPDGVNRTRTPRVKPCLQDSEPFDQDPWAGTALAKMIWLDEGGRQRFTRLIAPPPRLRGVVEHFWTQQQLPGATWRVVPDISAM